MARILLKDVWKKYGSVEAVKGINLEINDGEFFSFLGPSGCGKTSTMRMIAGLEAITSGEIYIGDRLVNNIRASKRDVAMAFETYALYPPLTVRENLAFPLQARKVPEKEVEKQVNEVARILQLTDVLDKKPGETSGGHQQRISLGRCIIRRPNLFLFDEPLSHVDSEARREMRGEIKRLQQLFEITSVYVTHDQLEAVALADRILVMNFGEIMQVGTPNEIYHEPRNMFVAGFIGEPPFNFLDATVATAEGVLCFEGDESCFTVPVPDRLKPKLAEQVGRNVKIGIRPMYISPSLVEREDSHLKGTIWVFEDLGERGVLTVNFRGELLRVVTSSEFEGQPEEPVWLTLDTSRMHAFNPQTQLNVLAAES